MVSSMMVILLKEKGNLLFVIIFRHGYGHYLWSEDGSKGNVYKGEWKYNIRHGKGIFIKGNGDNYRGDFKNNKYEGEGILKKQNKNYYQGSFKNGQFLNGKGVETSVSENGIKFVFTGNFVKGRREGLGWEVYENDKQEYLVSYRSGSRITIGVKKSL